MKQLVVPVEVFDRVSGYFRPKFNMNKGKQEEQRERKRASVQAINELFKPDVVVVQ